MARTAQKTTDFEKQLADQPPDGEDAPTQQDVTREDINVRPRTRRHPQIVVEPRPECKAFADALRAAMMKANVSASEAARRVWGTTTDNRGYEVARNRDRIGHYLAGTSYPEPENMAKLADALGVPVEELALAPENSRTAARQGGSPRRSPSAATGELIQTSLPMQPGKVRLQVDRVLDWKLSETIHRMLKEAEICDARNDESWSNLGKIVGGIDSLKSEAS